MSKYTDPGPITFEGLIESEGVGAYVACPISLKATYGVGNQVPVRVSFDGGQPIQLRLASMSGMAVIGLRKEVREAIGKAVGDRVQVRIELDATPRTVELAADAMEAIATNPAAQAGWKALAYSRQREYHDWIEGAKKAETRQRRIAQMVDALTGKGT